MKISVVIPVYGCPGALEQLHERLTETLLKITEEYEIILVNDGCPKGSWEIIEVICSQDPKVVGINLSRNFGQVNATNAGIEYSTGDYVVVMDCDLQDKPEAIYQLYLKLQEGYDIVYAGREKRKDTRWVKFCSSLYYHVYNRVVEGYYNPCIGNFCIVKRKIVDEYCALPEHNKAFTTVLGWMGYCSTIVMIEGEERLEGKSSYNLRRKMNMAIEQITFQSNKPLFFFIKLGLVIAMVALIYIVYQLCKYWIVGGAPDGWMSLIAVVSLLGGVQLVSIGVIGIYIGNIFDETKNRKSYFVQTVLNDKNK